MQTVNNVFRLGPRLRGDDECYFPDFVVVVLRKFTTLFVNATFILPQDWRLETGGNGWKAGTPASGLQSPAAFNVRCFVTCTVQVIISHKAHEGLMVVFIKILLRAFVSFVRENECSKWFILYLGTNWSFFWRYKPFLHPNVPEYRSNG